MDDGQEIPLGNEDLSLETPNIARGAELLPFLQRLADSHNPSEKAISIKFPQVINDFDCQYVQDNQEELGKRYPRSDLSGFIEIEYTLASIGGEMKLVKQTSHESMGEEDIQSHTEEVVDADPDEVNHFFSKYVLAKTQNGGFVLFGGDEFSNIDENRLRGITKKLEDLHLDVQNVMGIKGRPQIFLYRQEASIESEVDSSRYIDVVKGFASESRMGGFPIDTRSVARQLSKVYIEDYELVSNTRKRVVLSPELRKLNSRVERCKRLRDLGAPNYIIGREEELVNESLKEVYKQPMFRILSDERKKPPTIKDVEELGFNIKQLFPIGHVMEWVEMPYIFREGMAHFVGMKMSGMKIEDAMKDAIQTLGGYSSDVVQYYYNVLTEEYAKQLMPAMLWHFSNHFGLSVQEIAHAVSKTSNKDFSFETFFKELDIDPNEGMMSWTNELQRHLPR